MKHANYSLRKKNQEWENDSSTEIITEEINHNNYINKTTTYSILHSLTIYYRFCNAYLAYYDSKQTDKKHEGYKVILEGLVNSILIRSYISKYNYPIIESFQHYKQFSFKEIKDIYNFVTAKNADFFKKVESLIHEKVLDYNDEDIFLVAQTALNFPFIYQLKKSNLKFEKFWRLYSQYPEKVLRNILQFLSYSEKLDRAAFLKELDKISSTSKADYSVTGCLISFGTSKIIHKGLISFIIKQSLFTKYNKVISYYIKAIYQRKGGTINQAYDGSPAFKAWGIDDQEFNIDPAMGLFDSEAFTIAVLSFEPSLVGEKKNLNILNSNKCETILLRTIYLHCLTHCIINSLNYKDFLKNFDYIFNVRPILIPYKNCINNFLELVFSMSIGNLEKSSFNKYSRQINDKIIEYLITDIDKLRNKMYEEYSDIQRKMIFRVCDTLYAHGF